MKSVAQRREMVERGHPELSIVEQCCLLCIHHSGFYYRPRKESKLNEELMLLMDKHYLDHPYRGAPRRQTSLDDQRPKEVYDRVLSRAA